MVGHGDETFMNLPITELKAGTVFKDSGNPWVVLKYTHTKMGRGTATIKVKAKNLISGTIIEKSYGNGAKFEVADVARRNATYLYVTGDSAVFMDSETYDQFEIKKDSVEDSLPYLKEGSRVIVILYDSSPIGVELPKNVTLEVIEAAGGVKGDTAQSALMKVRVETGLEIMAPLFIKTGELIKIDTRTGDYLERVAK